MAASPPGDLRRIAAAAWAFRHAVEREAEARFARIAPRLAEIGAAPRLVELAAGASQDEARHADLCAGLAAGYGAALDAAPVRLAEIAPRHLGERERVLYEVVAACCVAETESLATLATLLAAAPPLLRDVLRELATDEVRHGRLGWSHLAAEQDRGDVSFLAPLVPAMLEGNAPADLFSTADPAREDPALLLHGVLPHAARREVFVRTLEEVVFPGLEQCGVDVQPARAWLAAKRRRGARIGGPA